MSVHLDHHHRRLARVWNRKQLAALATCCDLLLGSDKLKYGGLKGRRLVIYHGVESPDELIGAVELDQAIKLGFGRQRLDVLPNHLYLTNSELGPDSWLAALPEHHEILDRHTSFDRLFSRLGDQTRHLAEITRIGDFSTVILVCPRYRLVRYAANLLRQLHGVKVRFIPVGYGDFTARDFAARAFGEEGEYAELWHDSCQDGLPGNPVYWPTELRQRLQSMLKV